jgi:hypothetical protein
MQRFERIERAGPFVRVGRACFREFWAIRFVG